MTAHDIITEAPRVRRAIAVVLALLTVLLITPAANATEEAAPAPAEQQRLTYDELQRQSSDRAREFFPDAYAEPSFFQWILVPVLVAGLLIAVALLGAYLWWQPRFAAERRQKKRR